MKNSLTAKRLAPEFLAVAGVLLWSAILVASHDVNLEYTDTYVPALWLLGEVEPAQGSMLAIILPSVQSGLAKLLSLASYLGISQQSMQRVVVHLSMYAGFGALFLIGRTLAGSSWAGLLAMLLLPASWLIKPWLGYGLAFWEQNPGIGIMAAAFAAIVWAVWLNSRFEARFWLLPFVLLGLLFNLHPTNGIIIGFSFAFSVPFLLLASLAPFRALGRYTIGFVVSVVIASPQIISILHYLFADKPAAFNESDWWALMAFRKSHHVLLWTPEIIRAIGVLVLCYAALVLSLSRLVRRELVAKLSGLFVAAGLLSLVGYLGVEVWPNPTISGLVPSRSLDILIIVSVAMSAALFIRLLSAIRNGSGKQSMLFLPVVFLPLLLVMPRQEFVPEATIVLLAYLAAVLAFGQAPLPQPAVRPRRLNAWVASIAALSVFTVSLVAVSNSGAATLRMLNGSQPDAETVAVTDWIRRNTPRDSLFLFPPYPWITASTRRSNIIDQYHMGWSVYVHESLEFELNALENIYGVYLRGMSVDDVFSMADQNMKYYCMLENGYVDLMTDTGRVLELMENYPELDYVVAFQNGVRPYYWSCTDFDADKLDLPVAYQNDTYVVYRLPDGQEQ